MGTELQKTNTKISWPRKIIHVDMDAFFAAVEQRDWPEFQGKPVIVGGDPKSRGVVSTCSYEARKFGVHSAMSSAQAKRLCPGGIFLRPNFEKYRIVSNQIRSIFEQHTALVEPASLDEAYLDVTYHRFGIEDPEMIAKLIKQNIFAVTHLTASAGVAVNMFLAKIASDFKKPDGLTVIKPDEIQSFLKELPVRKVPGVGPVTEKRLSELGVQTCGELAEKNEGELYRIFGKHGILLSKRANGIDDSEVEPDGESKQYSSEETFPKDVTDVKWLKEKLKEYAESIFEELKAQFRMGKTIVLKVKYHDFQLITRSYTAQSMPQNPEEIWKAAAHLLETKTEAGQKPIRLLGLGISGLNDSGEEKKALKQGELFEDGC